MFKINLGKTLKPIIYVPRKNIANKVFLFTNARDEKFIAEWVAHHLLLGFDAIIIFDHKSKKPIKSIFNNKDKRIVVKTCILEGGIKIPLMKRARKIALKERADWFLYLDCDEYLCLNYFPNVKTMLKCFHFADTLAINWVMFGSCDYINDPGLIMENYTKSRPCIDPHVKTFVRPETITNVLNPHCYSIYDPLRMFCMPMKQLVPPYSFNQTILPYDKIGAFIAHYVYQSKETYIRRKYNLPCDDSGASRGDLNLSLLTLYNDTDNFTLKNKYSQIVKKKIIEIINK
jgi:hypothetical protein